MTLQVCSFDSSWIETRIESTQDRRGDVGRGEGAWVGSILRVGASRRETKIPFLSFTPFLFLAPPPFHKQPALNIVQIENPLRVFFPSQLWNGCRYTMWVGIRLISSYQLWGENQLQVTHPFQPWHFMGLTEFTRSPRFSATSSTQPVLHGLTIRQLWVYSSYLLFLRVSIHLSCKIVSSVRAGSDHIFCLLSHSCDPHPNISHECSDHQSLRPQRTHRRNKGKRCLSS